MELECDEGQLREGGPVAQPFTSLHQVSGGQYDEDNQQHETWMMERIQQGNLPFQWVETNVFALWKLI